MTKQTPASCGNCNVFRPGPVKGGKGLCYLQPPVPFIIGMQQDAIGRAQPITTAVRPMVGADEFCAMWQQPATAPAAVPMGPPPVVGLPDTRHPGSDTFNGHLVPRTVAPPPPPTDPVERAQPHRPVKVTGEWHCADCGAAGNALEMTVCKGKPDAETST